MKKGFLVLFVLILALLPVSSVFAQISTGRYEYGTDFTVSPVQNNPSGNMAELFDGKSSTTGTIKFTSSLIVTFNTPKKINELKHHANGLYYYFKDSTGALLTSFNVPNNLAGSITSYVVNKSDVKTVEIYNPSGNHATIADIQFFGDPPPVHDELSNLVLVDMPDGVSMSWDIPTGNSNFTGTKIYRNGTFLTSLNSSTNVYSDTTALDGLTYTYKITAVYSDGFETSGIVQTITPEAPDDLVAPAEPTNISYNTYTDRIELTFDNPTDSDFSKVNIYKDGVLVGYSTTGIYTVTGLQAETVYSIKLTSVDSSGNESLGVVQSISTQSDNDTVAPNAPAGVKVENASNGAIVSWYRNTETDIAGYNIYVDGVKYNATPVTRLSYSVVGLDAGSSYEIKVTAVDSSGNESGYSSAVMATPSVDDIPILGIGYSLSDIADGTFQWFSSLWLIVAFAVSIPLVFYISNRIKLLFLS